MSDDSHGRDVTFLLEKDRPIFFWLGEKDIEVPAVFLLVNVGTINKLNETNHA